MFGGTGRNIFNPALVGRLFITIAFPVIMTTGWQEPFTHAMTEATPLGYYKSIATPSEVDPEMVDSETVQALFTSASSVRHCAEDPCSAFDGVEVYCLDARTLKEAKKYEIEQAEQLISYSDLLTGHAAGSMGETCRIAIIVGGVFLMFTKAGNWRTPVTYIGAVFVFAAIGHGLLPERIAPPVFQVFTGGLLFGAFFMATDPVTSPFTRCGKYVFGILCGLLTVLIRSFSGYVEGVMFSIVIVNAFTPLIDHSVLALKYRPVKS